jgi:hypothetical protein
MVPAMTARHFILVLSGVVLAAGSAGAQTTRTYWTLEARIANAEVVVRGTIADLSGKVLVPPGGKTPDGVSWPDGTIQYTFAVKVDEVLKGNPRGDLRLVRTTSAYDRSYDEWSRARTPFLWFLTREKRAGYVGGALRLGKAVAAESGYRHGVAPPLFSMDFAVLKDPAEILARARAFAGRSPKPSAIHRVTVPRVVAQRCSASGDANFVLVPVEASLEQTAKRLINSPEDYVPKGDKLDGHSRNDLRLGGVNALRHFKSEANAALLRGLLKDPTEVLKTVETGTGERPTVKEYPIRAKAYEILSTWGVRVPQPVVEVIVPKPGQRD